MTRILKDDTEEKVSLSYTVFDTGLHCVIILLGSQRYTVYLFIQDRRCCIIIRCETRIRFSNPFLSALEHQCHQRSNPSISSGAEKVSLSYTVSDTGLHGVIMTAIMTRKEKFFDPQIGTN